MSPILLVPFSFAQIGSRVGRLDGLLCSSMVRWTGQEHFFDSVLKHYKSFF